MRKRMTWCIGDKFLGDEHPFGNFHELSEQDQKERKKVWRSKGDLVFQIIESFFTVGKNLGELDKKVKNIRFLEDEKSINLPRAYLPFLNQSFLFLEEHLSYLEKDKNPKAFKEFRTFLRYLLYAISEIDQIVSSIHIPSLPPTYYSFKDFVSFFSVLLEKPLDKKNFRRNAPHACSRHVKHVYHEYIKKRDEEDGERRVVEEKKPSPTQFSREEINVLSYLANKVRTHFWIDEVNYFPTCLPEDIREFATVLSLRDKVYGGDETIERVVQEFRDLCSALYQLKDEFQKFVKTTIPVTFIEGGKDDKKSRIKKFLQEGWFDEDCFDEDDF